MQIHEIQPKHKQRKRKRIGRGGKKGTYSGRGMKGQRARTGARFQPRIRELVKKYPKLRGYRQTKPKKVLAVNLDVLEKYFESGAAVNPHVLAEKRVTGTIKGNSSAIKILGGGEITKALTIENCLVSKSAREKIEKAGGTIK